MDALTAIKTNSTESNTTHLFEHYGVRCNWEGELMRSSCPIHGGNNSSSFVFSLEKGMYYCHACGAYGDLVQFVQEMENMNEQDFPSAVRLTLQLLGIEDNDLEIKSRPTKLIDDLNKWKKFKTNTCSIVNNYMYNELATQRRVTKFRNFTREVLGQFRLTFAPTYPFTKKDGSLSEVKNRLIMPINFLNETVGIAMRRTNENDMPKWLFQPPQFEKKKILYNLEDKWYDRIVIVEGIFDVWAFADISVDSIAVLGKYISTEQRDLLVKHTLDVVLAFDGDDAGIEATCDAIIQLRNTFNLQVINFPLGLDSNDVNNLDELYKTRVHYLDWIKEHKSVWEERLNKNKKGRV